MKDYGMFTETGDAAVATVVNAANAALDAGATDEVAVKMVVKGLFGVSKVHGEAFDTVVREAVLVAVNINEGPAGIDAGAAFFAAVTEEKN